MKRFISKVTLAAISLPLVMTAFVGCSDDDDVQPSNGSEQNTVQKADKLKLASLTPEKKSAVCSATNEFSWKMLSSVAKSESKEKNQFVSPLSMSIALAMLQNGANGVTGSEIIDGIGLNGYSSAEVNAYFSSIVNELVNVDPSIKLTVANSAIYNTGRVSKFDDDFTKFLTDNYGAEMKGGPFDDSMVSYINNWCSEKTNGMVDKIVDKLEAYNIFVLLNAIYFKGQFVKRLQTSEIPYSFKNASGKEVQQYFVSGDEKVNYFENAELSYGELPLGNKSYQAFFILPAEGKSTESTVDYLASNWNTVVGNLETPKVIFSAPRFKVKFECGGDKMREVLNGLGIKTMFSPGAADLMACVDSAERKNMDNLYVQDVTQKTFFELSETGVEASAVTRIILGDRAILDPEPVKYLNLNRPFIFGIRDMSTGTILFNGICNDPTLEELNLDVNPFN